MSDRECGLLNGSLLKTVRKSSVVLASALLTSVAFTAIATTTATAQTATTQTATTQTAQPDRPSLSDLINTVPERPIIPLQTAEPASTTPTAAAEAAIVEEDSIRLVLRLSARRVYVYRGDSVEKSYPVAIGRPGWETPTGEFEIFHQITDPGWTNPLTLEVMPPGPENPLGDRWIAFWTDGDNSIGFHGTPNRNSVGKAASHGCIRMYNEDVRELYSMVDVGTSVTVVQ